MSFRFVVAVAILSVFLGSCKKKTATATDASDALFYDDFNRADENLSASSDWTVTLGSGASAVVSNQKFLPNPSATITEAYSTASLTSTDSYVASVSVDINGTLSGYYEFFIGANLDSHHYTGTTQSYYCGVQMGTLRLLRDLSIAASGSVPLTFSGGSSWDLVFTRTDNSVTCAITNGVTSDSVTYTDSSPLSDGYFGILIDGSSVGNNISFDDFIVASF